MCFWFLKEEIVVKKTIIRLGIEAIGWVMTIIGAFYVFGDDPQVIHYFVFGIGIILIILNFPYQHLKRKS